MDEHHELSKWLIAQCEERNLSWSEASRRAGVRVLCEDGKVLKVEP